jgi:ABC-type glycerol-3-phosphate transport system substrate-binding protein
MKKLISLLLMMVMAITSFGTVGCNREQGQKFDETKSLLNIGVMNAGMGLAWAEEAEKDFEAFYANTVFEDGKQGVDVVIDGRKDEFVPGALRSTMAGYKNAIYFVNQSDYDGYIADGLLADITSTVNEKIYDDNGDLAVASGKPATQSIIDTMQDAQQGRHVRDNKYYGVPWCYSVNGLVYDADLFNENEYYFDANGNIGLTQADVDAGNCGPGPDGRMGTADDGMPATYPDFLKLLRKMKNEDGITPFTWASTEYQRRYAYESIWANYEGYDDYLLNYTFEGTDAQLGAVTPATAAQVLSEQEGRKAGIQFFHDIIRGKYYSSEAFKNTYIEGQTEYVYSVNTNNRIAFFMEGGYWEREAAATFERMAVTNKDHAYGKRNFKLFPIPNFVGVDGITDQTNTNEPEVILGGGEQALVFITAKNTCQNPELQLKLAKLFLQFVNSREQLAKFTKNTGACFRCYDFTPTEEELSSFTKFAQSIYSYIEDGSEILPCLNYADARKDSTKYGDRWTFSATVGKTTFYCPASVFDKNANLTVDQCFDYVKNYVKGIK